MLQRMLDGSELYDTDLANDKRTADPAHLHRFHTFHSSLLCLDCFTSCLPIMLNQFLVMACSIVIL